MKTLVHLVSGDESERDTALAIAENLVADENGSIEEVAVVVQSKGIQAVTADGDSADRVTALMDDGVTFSACANTLETMDMEESALVEGIETVPEGAVEVTRLQDEGFAYLRP